MEKVQTMEITTEYVKNAIVQCVTGVTTFSMLIEQLQSEPDEIFSFNIVAMVKLLSEEGELVRIDYKRSLENEVGGVLLFPKGTQITGISNANLVPAHTVAELQAQIAQLNTQLVEVTKERDEYYDEILKIVEQKG